MDIQTKREEIQALIDNIKEHSDRLKPSKNLPLLELSVILSKITQLHEKTLILKYLAEVRQNHEEEEFGSSPIFQKEIDEEDDNESDEVIETKLSIDEDKSLIAESEDEAESESNHDQEMEDVSGLDLIISDKVENIIHEFESEEELPSKPDLNEAFTEEEDSSLSDQLQKQPIQDLLTAIGLNERYLYANELFNGDIEDFRSVIRRLNEFESGKDAKAYFDNELKESYNWEADNKLVKALYLLVDRRYN